MNWHPSEWSLAEVHTHCGLPIDKPAPIRNAQFLRFLTGFEIVEMRRREDWQLLQIVLDYLMLEIIFNLSLCFTHFFVHFSISFGFLSDSGSFIILLFSRSFSILVCCFSLHYSILFYPSLSNSIYPYLALLINSNAGIQM